MNQSSTGIKAEFRNRDRCISCDLESVSTIWSGRYSDDVVMQYLQQDFYHADLNLALGDAEFNLVRCNECKIMFHQRILSYSWLEILYSEWIDSQQIEKFEARSNVKQNRHYCEFEKGRQLLKHGLRLDSLLRDRFPEATNFAVLDFGCGDSQFISSISHLGFDTYGIDFSSSRVERSDQHGVQVMGSLDNFKALDVEELHAVTLFQTLEHLDEPRQVLKDLVDCLSPGGILIVEVPDCSNISGAPKNIDEFHNVHPLEHINNFTPATLTEFCERLGLERISRIPAHITTNVLDLLRTEVSRFFQPRKTNQYFRKVI